LLLVEWGRVVGGERRGNLTRTMHVYSELSQQLPPYNEYMLIKIF
jgi:hypothetical protein